jgi:hypothetical protein
MSKYTVEFNDAEREQLYAKIAFAGASGSGKTVGALKMAYGLADGDWSKVAVADTENKRALAYVGTEHTGLEIGKFKHAPIAAPYDSEKFIAVIDTAIKIGAKVLIIDSMSHQWEGIGGVRYEAEEGGGAFWDWKAPKKKHQSLKDYIQQSPIHIIVTMRTKQEYAVIPGGGNNGKNGIQKLGMKPVQEDSFDYEFLCSFHLDEDNLVKPTKDNTGLFKGEHFRMEVEHGQMLREWLVEGKEVKTVAEEKAEKLARHKFLVDTFQALRAENEKADAYFTQQEIKNKNLPLDKFPLDALEKLYAKMNKPKEENKVSEEPKKTEGVSPTADRILQVVDASASAKELYDEFMRKNKAETLEDLKPDRQELLLKMLEVRQNTENKKEEVNV